MEIKISRKSWHYRWLELLMMFCKSTSDLRFDAPKSICTYFWTFVLTNLMAIGLCILLLAAGCLILFLVIGPFIFTWSWLMNGSSNAMRGLIAVSIIDLVFMAIFFEDKIKSGFSDAKDITSDKWDHVTSDGFGEICIKSFQATKQKICPLIQYRD